MQSNEIRKRFLNFFEKRGHTIVPSSSLVPTDPSVLLTTAGMQQFKEYYIEPLLSPAPNIASVQKCLRTSDIDEVGDDSHLTFFEMLGNFSFGGYFKEEAIKYAKEFLESAGLKIEYVTVFGGEDEIDADEESEKIWKGLGVNDIRKAGKSDNFWGPTGSEGPCGPTTEIYIKGVELWNLVFNEYYCDKDKKLIPLKQKGVDTGMGLERLAMVLQGKTDVFETDLFEPIMTLLVGLTQRERRIVADHLRGIAFLIADGIKPSNKDRGYILRRLMRRVFVLGYLEELPFSVFEEALRSIIYRYSDFYKELSSASSSILEEFRNEFDRFGKTLDIGVKEFFKKFPELRSHDYKPGKDMEIHKTKVISGDDAFYFHQTYGLTLDVIHDLARTGLHRVGIDEIGFERARERHQETSRAGQEKKFGGHGLVLDTGEVKAANEEELKQVTSLHTATHLLQAALRQVLGPEVRQKGSDITAERLRFDFTFPRKITPEELNAAERLVREKINEKLKVEMREMPLAEALSGGALTVEGVHYPERVKVYGINNFSKEVCGGPHVKNTSEVGQFKIIKEEAVAAGIRRIRGALE